MNQLICSGLVPGKKKKWRLIMSRRKLAGQVVVVLVMVLGVCSVLMLAIQGCGVQPQSSSVESINGMVEEKTLDDGQYTKDMARWLPDQYEYDAAIGAFVEVAENLRIATPKFEAFCTRIAEGLADRTLTADEIELFNHFSELREVDPEEGLYERHLSHTTLVNGEIVTAGVSLFAGSPDRNPHGHLDAECTTRDTTRYWFRSGGTLPATWWDGTTSERHQYVSSITFGPVQSGWSYYCNNNSFSLKARYAPQSSRNRINDPACCNVWTDHYFRDMTNAGSNQVCAKAKIKIGSATELSWTTKQLETSTTSYLDWGVGVGITGFSGTSAANCSLFVAPHLAVKYADGGTDRWMWQARSSNVGSGADDEGFGWTWCPTYQDPSSVLGCVGDVLHGRMEWGLASSATPGVDGNDVGFYAFWGDDEGVCGGITWNSVYDYLDFRNNSAVASVTIWYKTNTSDTCPACGG